MTKIKSSAYKTPLALVILFFAVATLIILTSTLIYTLQKESITKTKNEELATIAQLKIAQIEKWTDERLEDAYAIMQDNLFIRHVEEFYKDENNARMRDDILTKMRSVDHNSEYFGIALTSKAIQVKLTTNKLYRSIGLTARASGQEAVRRKIPVISKIHFTDIIGKVHLDMIIPLLKIVGRDTTVIGTIVIRIDPNKFLYPSIQIWPQKSATAEAILLQVENDSLVYTNNLRFRPHAALRLKTKLNDSYQTGMQMIESGYHFMSGKDYRGEDVIAYVGPIHHTPWFLVAKMDQEEAYSPIRIRAIYLTLITILLLLIEGIILWIFWIKISSRHKKDIEQALSDKKALQHHFEYLIKYANDVILLADLSKNIIESNNKAEEVYGYDHNSFLNLRFEDLWSPSSSTNIPQTMDQIGENEGLLCEAEHQKKDGSSFHVEISIRLISIESLRYYQIIIKDVDERKKAERRIVQLMRIYDLLSSVNQSMMHATTREQLLKDVCEVAFRKGQFSLVWVDQINNYNDEIERVVTFGYEKEKILDLFHISPAELRKTAYIKSILNNETMVVNDILAAPLYTSEVKNELKNVFRSRVSFPFKINDEYTGAIVFCSKEKDFFTKDECDLLLALVRDIEFANEYLTSNEIRKRTELLLFQTNQRLQLVLNNIPQRVFWKDSNSIYLGCNQAYARDCGLPDTSSIFGVSDFDLFDQETASYFREDDQIVLSSNVPKLNYEELQRRHDGTMAWIRMSKMPLFDKDGQKLGVLGSYEDITEWKKLREQLIAAKDNAEEMSRLKSSFLANMSHELRTPMIGILGYTEIMQEEIEDPKFKDMAQRTYISASRLLETLNQILDLSRIEANRIDILFKECDIMVIINDVIALFNETAAKKGLQLMLHSELDSLMVSTDPRIFTQVMNNLLNNAVKFTNQGSISVSISQVLENGGQWAQVEVIDTGIGISPENQDIIWEEFRQVSEGRNRGFEGTGLGLTITRKFIERLHGTISLESEAEKGSTFRVRIPIKQRILSMQKPDIQILEETENLSLDNATKESRARVLLVENDETTIDIVRIYFRGRYNLDVVMNALDAIKIAQEKQFDAILMDINLGIGLTGMDAVKEIRTMDSYKVTPIAALTAFAMMGDKEEFLSGGCTHYLSKPFDKNTLTNLVESMLKG
jgi:PAS domain S-box-containing protein